MFEKNLLNKLELRLIKVSDLERVPVVMGLPCGRFKISYSYFFQIIVLKWLLQQNPQDFSQSLYIAIENEERRSRDIC